MAEVNEGAYLSEAVYDTSLVLGDIVGNGNFLVVETLSNDATG